MNDFKQIAQIVKNRKQNINYLYKILQNNQIHPLIDRALELAELDNEKSNVLAILRRLVDLKEENLIQELEKKGLSEEEISQIKYKVHSLVRAFYEVEHQDLIDEIKTKNLLDEFYLALIQGVHNIGVVMNSFDIVWSKQILDTNNKILKEQFPNLSDALEFLKQNKLYQLNQDGQICERSYGALVKIGTIWRFLPYAKAFENEVLKLEYEFDKLLEKLKKYDLDDGKKAYINYLEKLKFAFCEKNNDEVIKKWQEAELAWMEVKSPLQIGHPLEYYEDSYTHAVALEWDIRLEDVSDFNTDIFKQNIKESFSMIYENLEEKDEKLFEEVNFNLNKTQLYICMPMIFYGAELKGLFSAQVVPNDEYVSNIAGKKIFAFLNYVYENAKTKPFMKLPSMVFEKEFLDYGRQILFFNEKLWKKIYEVSTIGHEFGHIFFVANDSEKKMNESGVFKNIEEFKATAGGLVNFFLHEEEELKLPVFYELIKRAVGLIAWQKVEEVKPYYTEGLIHLSLLFKAEVLKFEDEKLNIDFSIEAYERFKKVFLENYYELARHYVLKEDAKKYLDKFCTLEDEIFLPLDEECKEFVKYYYELYQLYGNDIDESGEFEKYINAIESGGQRGI
ncbi:invasion protein CiaB [Campylobacter volucris]|uniref:Invasion protein CiaB n=1 Tax=Campylobacter volucris TaxID=1031542 RepID=A0A5C7E3D5_9BACT|nr:invasion protein CiaB [Campylobacter volucris]TXE88585.1 invasion protein CiaB [Campylobacter volucris]